MRDWLMWGLQTLTHHPRYHPEEQEVNGKTRWSKNIWISNVFRLCEYLFGRGYGIKREAIVSAYISDKGQIIVDYRLYSLEANLAHIEYVIRTYLYILKTFLYNTITFKPLPRLDYKPVYITLGILGLVFSLHTSTRWLPLFGLAIAADVNTSSTITGTPLTYTHISTGSNLIMIGCLGIDDNPGPGDILSTFTYNSVALVIIDKANTPNTSFTNKWGYMYDLVAPTSGSNSVSISTSSSHNIRCTTRTYSGAKQSGQPDNHTTNQSASATSLTDSITTVADNCWAIGMDIQVAVNHTAGTGANNSVQEINVWSADSNGAVHPAGSYSITWNSSPADSFNDFIISIAPAVAEPAFVSFRTLLGVGRV